MARGLTAVLRRTPFLYPLLCGHHVNGWVFPHVHFSEEHRLSPPVRLSSVCTSSRKPPPQLMACSGLLRMNK